MAGTAGELAFVATLTDDATRGAQKLNKTMKDIGGPTKPITTDVRCDIGDVSKAVAQVDGAEAQITDSLKAAGKVGGDKLAEGIKAGGEKAGTEAAQAAKKGADQIPGVVEQSGKKAASAGKASGRETGKGFADGVEGSITGAKDAVAGVIEGIGVTGPAGAAAAGAAVGLAFVGALSETMDVEVEQDRLAASLGATGPLAAKAGKVAGDLYANAYGDSLPEVTDAVEQVSKNVAGLNKTSEKDFKDITAGVINVSKVFRQDFGKTTSAVGQLMRTGLAKNATEALDLITKGLEGPANKSDDLLDTLNEYPIQFAKLGLSGKQALGLVSQGVQAGARDSDVAADALKEFAIRATDGSKTTATGFKAIGLSADVMAKKIGEGGPKAAAALGLTLDKLRDIKDPAKRAQVAVALFGTQSEDMAAALNAMDLTTAEKEIGDVGGAAKTMGDTFNDNAKTKLTTWSRSVRQHVVQFLGSEAIPAIEHFADSVRTNLGPVLSDLKTNALPGVKQALKDAKQLWEDNKDKVIDLVTNLGILATNLETKLKPAFDAVWPVARDLAAVDLTHTIQSIDAMNNLLSGKKDDGSKLNILEKLEQLGPAVQKLNLPAYLGSLAGQAIATFGTKFLSDSTARASVGTWIANNFQNVVSFLPFGSLINVGSQAGNAVINGLFGKTPNAAATAKRFMSGLGQVIAATNPLQLALSVGSRLGLKIGDGIASASSTIAGRAKSVMVSLGRSIVNSSPIGVVSSAMSLLGKDLIGGLVRGVKGAVGGAVHYIGTIPGQLANGGNWGTVLIDAGRRVISGLVSGIRGAIPDVQSVLGSVTNLIPSWKGPPKKDKTLLTPAGRQIMHGLITGFKQGTPGVMKYLGLLTKAIASKRGISVQIVNKQLAPVTKKIVAYAKAHDVLIGKLTAAKTKVSELVKVRDDYAASVREGLLSSADVTKFETVNDAPLTAGFIVKQLKDRLKAIVDYRNNLAKLRSSKVSADIIRDIEAAGVEGGGAAAAALAKASKAQIGEINGIQAQISKQATDTGKVAAGAWYQTGVNAAQGVVNGLTSQLKRVDAAGVAMAKALDAAMRRQLGIHSPSKVTHATGENVGYGLAGGVISSIGVAEKAARTMAQRVADAATPSLGQLTALTAPRSTPIVVSRVQDTVVIRHEVAFRGQAPAGITADQVADLIARDPKSAAKIEQALKSPRARKSTNTLTPSR